MIHDRTHAVSGGVRRSVVPRSAGVAPTDADAAMLLVRLLIDRLFQDADLGGLNRL
jgi:hypothetical protein